MRLGLALGGGGARGAAHVGIIEELENLDLRPDLITGASIGGLFGALYAAGVSPQEMMDFFADTFNLTNMYSLPGSQPGLSNNQKIEERLEKKIGRLDFKDLQIPLALVATNLVTKREVILDEGDVISAVLASMAFPVLFPPVERDGLTLIDGGLVNNVPFDIARARGANWVIAVDLGNAAAYGTMPEMNRDNPGFLERALHATKRRPLWQVITAVSDIITNRSVSARMAIVRPEVLLQPYMGTIGLLDIQEAEKARQAGRKEVNDHQEPLETIRDEIANARRAKNSQSSKQ